MRFEKQRWHCNRYIPILKLIAYEPMLNEWCMINARDHQWLSTILDSEMTEHAYSCGMVIKDFDSILERHGMDRNMALSLIDDADLASFSPELLLACITCHYESDRMAGGDTLLPDSVSTGKLLALYRAFMKITATHSAK